MFNSHLYQEFPVSVILLHFTDEVLLLDSVHLSLSRGTFDCSGMESFTDYIFESNELAFTGRLNFDDLLFWVFVKSAELNVHWGFVKILGVSRVSK